MRADTTPRFTPEEIAAIKQANWFDTETWGGIDAEGNRFL